MMVNIANDDLLRIQNLKKYFPIETGFLRRVVGHVKAVDDVSFEVKAGETFGLVGESGSGKTTLGRCVLRALQPTDGEIYFHYGEDQIAEMSALSEKQLKDIRPHAQMIFQDPFSSLDPRWTVAEIISEPLQQLRNISRDEKKLRVQRILNQVGLEPSYLNRYPHAFSGGQRQRIGIARALVTQPKLIVADEPVSALDVSIQAQILNLLMDLQSEMGLTYLFVAHDLSVVEHISTRVGVMYVGKLMELTSTDELFTNPLHPYTEALLSAVPKPDPDTVSSRIKLSGEIADPANPPSGCYFHPRCPYAKSICSHEVPIWSEYSPGHFAVCHFADQLKLRGV